MADRLLPNHADAYLSPWGVVSRLKSEFSYVEADGEEGRRHVLEILERLKAGTLPPHIDPQIAGRLNRIKNRALFVCFGDDASSDAAVLATYVVPGMPLLFEYTSVEHEHAVHDLLSRCAAALGYEIHKDRRSVNVPGYGGRERRRSLDRRSGVKDRRR